MVSTDRIESTLLEALEHASGNGCPPKLAEAMHYAVFPGGARVRPKLCLAAAMACAEDSPELVNAAAASIELLHCASLVHDDLPCFDDAEIRRGKPSVHRAFGEDLAVLTGDALIVQAFQVLGRAGRVAPRRLGELLCLIGDSVGGPTGIVAGQAWESEPKVTLVDYERSKTGSLFAAATAAGAIACGADPNAWGKVGDRIGEAYQVADDILDFAGDPEKIGKPVGQDAVHGRPSFAIEHGLKEAKRRLEHLVSSAIRAIPPCPGRAAMRQQVAMEARRFTPDEPLRAAEAAVA